MHKKIEIKSNLANKKIGIFGGTFNPFHAQHYKIAKVTKKQLNLDEIWLIISKKHIEKEDNNELLSLEKRVKIINLALSAHDKKWIIIKTTTDKYSYETLTQILNQHKKEDYKFYFIIGGDQASKFDNWYKYTWILNNFKIVVAPRKGFTSIFSSFIELKMNNKKCSSTKIRKGLQTSQYCLNPKVRKYINANGLFLLQKLQHHLSKKRLNHCLKTGKIAKKIAKLYNLDSHTTHDIYAASLLHDITKEWKKNEHLKYLQKENKHISLLKEPEAILHSFSGALYVKKKLKFNTFISSLIKKHTTAACKMNVAEKILFIADKMANKKIPQKNYLFPIYKLNHSIFTYLNDTYSFLKKNNLPIYSKAQNILKCTKKWNQYKFG